MILFRQEYGVTKWTKIEETAIRNRGYEEGYDFVVLIPTEKQIAPPKWLPKNRLWVGLERWGIKSAASVIEARVQEFGGIVKIETIADIAARNENRINEERKREQLLNSTEAILLFNEEVKKLKDLFKKQVEEIKSRTENWSIKYRENENNGVDILSYGYMLYFHFYQPWGNTIQDAYLFVAIYKGYSDKHGYFNDPFDAHKLIDLAKLRLDINDLNEKGWSEKDTRKNFVTSQKLADTWFTKFLPYTIKAQDQDY